MGSRLLNYDKSHRTNKESRNLSSWETKRIYGKKWTKHQRSTSQRTKSELVKDKSKYIKAFIKCSALSGKSQKVFDTAVKIALEEPRVEVVLFYSLVHAKVFCWFVRVVVARGRQRRYDPKPPRTGVECLVAKMKRIWVIPATPALRPPAVCVVVYDDATKGSRANDVGLLCFNSTLVRRSVFLRLVSLQCKID